MYYPFETQVSPLVNVRRERMLPAPGEILVRIGERVDPTQVVARTELFSDFQILPVARLLGVPAAKIKKYMQVKLRDTVQQGQVIATRRGLPARLVKSPIDGIVTASGGGRFAALARLSSRVIVVP